MSRPILLAVAGVFGGCFVAASAVAVTHPTGHLELQLVLVQYVFLLPAVVFYLLADRALHQGPSPPRAWPFAASCLIYAIVVIFIALYVIHKDKGLQFGDEVAYRFEARVVLNGRLAADAPPRTSPDRNSYLDEFHFDHFIIQQNRWNGIFPPGWPAVLALGTALRLDWLLNPLLGLFILWIAYRLACLLYEERVARTAVLLMVASPFFLINSDGFMSHPLCGGLLAAATLFLFYGLKGRPIPNFAAMLALVGLALLVRQWTAFCMGAVLGISAAWSLRNKPRQLFALIGIGALAGAAAAAMLLAYNHALTGSYWRTTYAVAENREFSANFNFKPASLLNGLVVVTRRSLETTDLYAVPFILLLAAYALFAEKERRRDAWVLGALFLVLVIGYTAQPLGSASTIGERYYYESFFAVAVLGARGWSLVQKRWSVAHWRVVILAIGGVCCFHYLLAINDVRTHAAPHIRVINTVDSLKLTDAVVYVKGEVASHFNENAADWRHAPVFYMMDPGPSRRSVIAEKLSRSEWVVISYNAKTQSAHIEDREFVR